VDFESEVAVAREAAAAAGELIAAFARGARESWQKAEDSPVTHADLEANRAIRERLARAFPDDAILSEETQDSAERVRAERVWIIDPLDGTKEFIAGIPEYAVSIALAVRGEPAVGVVLEPSGGECFWGAQGRGAWLGAERLRVAADVPLSASRVLSSRTEMSRGQVDRYAGWFGEMVPVGSAALKLAWVAAGRAHGWLSVAPKSEWDVCAGDLLVREAGGAFEASEGAARRYNQRDVLLAPPMAAGSHAWLAGLRARSRAC
jgi:myo-inositol-1(or 4)-monophosphatase